MAQNATILVVDDDAAIRKALARLFAAHDYQVETYESADDFLQHAAASDKPSCMILDLSMPGLGGLDLQQEIARREIEIPIVFLTGRGEIPDSVRAIKAGAVDFVTKPFDHVELLEIVARAIAEDEPQRQQRKELRELRRRYESLTNREKEVFERVAAGLLNKQIAAQLGAAEKTIKVHRGRVMTKMKANSVADLVRMAGRLGIPS